MSTRNDRSAERRRKRLAGEAPAADPTHSRRADKLRAVGVDPAWVVPVFDALNVWCRHDYKDSDQIDVSHDLAAEAAAAGIEEMLNAIHRPRATPLHFAVRQQFDAWAKTTARRAARAYIIAAAERQTELVVDRPVCDSDDGESVEAIDRLSYRLFEHEQAEGERCPKNVRYKGAPPECDDIALHPVEDRHLRRSRDMAHDVDYTAPVADDDDAPEWQRGIA